MFTNVLVSKLYSQVFCKVRRKTDDENMEVQNWMRGQVWKMWQITPKCAQNVIYRRKSRLSQSRKLWLVGPLVLLLLVQWTKIFEKISYKKVGN